MQSKRLDRFVVLASITGILLSTYALYVEMAVEARPGYSALCDISEYASCSRVLSSDLQFFGDIAIYIHTLYVILIVELAFCVANRDRPLLLCWYSKGFGIIAKESAWRIPNPVYGVIFYCLIIFLTTFDQLLVGRFLFLIAVTSIPMCVYLAYLLAFVLHDVCVVCISTYVVNFTLVVLTYKKMNAMAAKKK